jgi:hypothetical protein
MFEIQQAGWLRESIRLKNDFKHNRGSKLMHGIR